MTATCCHCGRAITQVDGVWIDPEATGDDEVWRETCDQHNTFPADHEPYDEHDPYQLQTGETSALNDRSHP